ncbi:hypothetical protein CAPTEDRAFT_154354 [Capitella teleta]|uniref:UBR-type domain-containing protein n=1 Tax=Capitella teleta TaxID=283909 RepID=R7V3P2_CAPTE|nr:hypothetical protein CAPTEDRAFT_154354 [Capitella teleta]|eukprot:ELU10961.1 hypothetical protein CAPTEDRAFT_154354 [Capitella teleta]
MTCLHTAMSVSMAMNISSSPGPLPRVGASSRDEDVDVIAMSLIKRALEVFNLVSDAIKSSTRASGNASFYPNFQLLGAWCILRGLHSQVNWMHSLVEKPSSPQTMRKTASKSDTPKSSKDSSLSRTATTVKSHSGFGVFSVPLAYHAVTLLSGLMEDLLQEPSAAEVESTDLNSLKSWIYLLKATLQPEATDSKFCMSFTDCLDAFSRVKKLTSAFNLVSLLFSILNISFRKVFIILTDPTGSDRSSSCSDSNTFYEEDFSSSDDSSDEDDDSEPILGHWFEETMLPHDSPSVGGPDLPSGGESDSKAAGTPKALSDDSDLEAMEKRQPQGFLSLATSILQMMNSRLFDQSCFQLTTYVRASFSDTHMSTLASVIKDLDRESPAPDHSVYGPFSSALAKVVHTLISGGLLTDANQDVLLEQLGVDPKCASVADPWPLTVHSRTLSCLAQVLLLRQQRERQDAGGALNGQSEIAVKNIWNRFLQTLTETCVHSDGVARQLEGLYHETLLFITTNIHDFTDINVEHLQLLIFLLHGLPLMVKKNLLLRLSPLPVTRLLVMMDYLLHYFYDPPPQLIEQVQYNLFGAFVGATGVADETNRKYFLCSEVEDNYWKNLDGEAAKGPRFYNLGPADYTNQDTPKIDGLACSFLQSNPDMLDYNAFYDGCISFLSFGSRVDKTKDFSFLDACCMQYHLLVCWRLLGSLPPSIQFLQDIESEDHPMDDSHILHSLRWLPRLNHKAFKGWAKDSLVKQGMTTQKSDATISNVIKKNESILYDVKMALRYIQDEIIMMPPTQPGGVLQPSKLPGIHQVIILDSIIAKVQVMLDDAFTQSMTGTDSKRAMEISQGLLPAVFLLIEAYTVFLRSLLLSNLLPSEKQDQAASGLHLCSAILSISSSKASKGSIQRPSLLHRLPGAGVIERWTTNTAHEFPNVGSWRNAFANDILPDESYMDAILMTHLGTLSSESEFSAATSLKHTLQALVRFCSDLILWCPEEKSPKQMVQVLFPLIFDASTEYLADFATLTVERVLGPMDDSEFTSKTYAHVLAVCHDIIINHSGTEGGVDQNVLLDCLSFMESQLEKPAGKVALEKFYSEKNDLVSLLLSAATDHATSQYGTKVLKFFNKLFQLAEKNPADTSYAGLCCSLKRLALLDTSAMNHWLSTMILGPSMSTPNEDSTTSEDDEMVLSGSKTQENRLLLQSLTAYIVKENSHLGEEVASAILQALLPMGSQILSPLSEGIGFPELMVVMATLAGAGSGMGHVSLFKAAISWLDLCKQHLLQKNVVEKLQQNVISGKHQIMLESACYLLSYIADILSALKRTSTNSGADSPLLTDGDYSIHDADSDWADDTGHDDESGAEDSDEDSLNNKLCTFSVTQKEFMNQHWYHCHTCKMVDSVGVCTVCAKVCHKDHDLSYAKYGNFFCDCGARGESHCQALSKRSSAADGGVSSDSAPSPFSMETMLTSRLRRRLVTSHPVGEPEKTSEASSKKAADKASKAREMLCRQIENCKDSLMDAQVRSYYTVGAVVELLQSLMPGIVEHCQKTSPLGSTLRATQAMDSLRTMPKIVETTDQLMTATLGSQEGAFENVRMNYSGDAGQTIRQLIASNVLRRVAMCCMSSPLSGKRQHLAVSHEKGKVTILQLSALLKQADSSKRKLTLTRLGSAPIPFTVLTIAGNPANEDFLAVCGLKDCHVLTFNSSGSVTDHLVLHPSLESGNFIIKAVWLPGSQTKIAVITADFVKVYDLSKDAISPQFYFLLPSGKIRDATFIIAEDSETLLLMSSSGYIYTQSMDDESSAEHGPFYITNILEVKHPDLKDIGCQVAGGGVSIHYSHALQLLFFSYTHGRSFAAPVLREMTELATLFSITFKGSNGGGKSGSVGQPLVQWMEVANHPGLVCCMTQSGNIPIILMVKPDSILVQEIKVLPAKAKIQDMVAIRHSGSGSFQRTTLILLCEDGSLRIYMANVDATNFWMSASLQPQNPILALKPTKKKKISKPGRASTHVMFPADFFEHCQHSSDMEFGGNDILQVYNVAQVKHRLSTAGMFIACTKPAGFTVEVNNTNASNVMVGVRVQVGGHALERVPTYIEVFGRSTQVNATVQRWVDLPFTREESLTADKKMTIHIGPSNDPAGITVIDSIKVHVKSKDVFGWPEDAEDFAESTSSKTGSSASALPGLSTSEAPGSTQVTLPLTSIDRLLASSMEVLDGCFSCKAGLDDLHPLKQVALYLASPLLVLSVPPSVQQQAKMLLSTLHQSHAQYHEHKDQVQVTYVVQRLQQAVKNHGLDAEAFQHLVLTARSVAISRPCNLVKYANKELCSVEDNAKSPQPDFMKLSPLEQKHFMVQLTNLFWQLLAARPANQMIAPACMPGLMHVDATVGALVDIIHAFTSCDLDNIHLAAKLYTRLLLHPDPAVSFACKQALLRAMRPKHKRRKVFVPSPPRCSTPGAGDDDDDDDDDDSSKALPPPKETSSVPPPQVSVNEPSADDTIDDAQFDHLEGNMAAPSAQQSALEALLAASPSLPAMLHIPPDADDETMVELAIALSLQDQSSGVGNNLSGLRGFSLQGQPQEGASLDVGQLSDTTASAPGSDDEVGSTAATDGSNLRTSPAEHAGSGGSESGGSNAESGGSGQSSQCGDLASEAPTSNPPSTQAPSDAAQVDESPDSTSRLHHLRLLLLERLSQFVPELREVGGVRSIPFMQVLLMLTTDIDNEDDRDKKALDGLLTILLTELNMISSVEFTPGSLSCRTLNHEMRLIVMRLLSVLMSRTKAGTKPAAESSSFLSVCTGSALLQVGALDYCLNVLKALLDFWKQAPSEEGSLLPGQLLRPHPSSPIPDMSPFFLRQYVKGHANDIFEAYPQLLTEMVLRLPYQMKKIAESGSSVAAPFFDSSWLHLLAEYMMTQQAPFVRRQVRKLLLYVCGSKESYRQIRDTHALDKHMVDIRSLCEKSGLRNRGAHEQLPVMLPYDVLINLIEHIKACTEIATVRTSNWQKFCLKDEEILTFLMEASISLDDGVSPLVLQLLQCALCGSKALQPASNSSSMSSKSKKERSKDKTDDSTEIAKAEEEQCSTLVQYVCKNISRDLLLLFIRAFLLDSNSTSVRWQAHALVLHIYRNSSSSHEEVLLDLMWSLWPEVPAYGRKAAQFVDLLGYFTIKTPQIADKKTKLFVERSVAVLRSQNKVLSSHPNGTIYNLLQGLVDFDGYYLESDPCLVCNNPEVPYSNLKLSVIKEDSKFTTSTQIVKLIGSHTISKIILRISDIKRTKMVRTINLFYNNRTVQAVVELKNKPGVWHKAKKVVLSAGQNEVKVDFPLPIVACNLMVEYADFYDNLQATSETLQCPRCSASVPANPGVCANCGENVFQCHKCRAINYDEKDPFLCNACGFCKYAKFDFTLVAKPCCAVDPIENEEDRKKAISNINGLLEKADRLYKQLQLNKPALEALLIRVSEQGGEKLEESSGATSASSNTSSSSGLASVNHGIQQLAQRYCGDCKNTFDDLSKIIQKVLASRKELVEYDRQQKEAALAYSLPGSMPSTPVVSPRPADATKAKEVPSCDSKPRERLGRCYGCASATVEHYITLLRALATNSTFRVYLCGQGLIPELVDYNLRRGSPAMRTDVRQLLCLLTKDNPVATEELNALLVQRIVTAIRGHLSNPSFATSVRNEILLLANTLYREDSCWEQRLRCVMKLFLYSMRIKNPVVLESIALPCLRILQHVIRPAPPTSQRYKACIGFSKMKSGLADLHIDSQSWLAADPNASFASWRRYMPDKGIDLSASGKKKEKKRDPEMDKRVNRVKYLMEKYGQRWINKVLRVRTIPLSLAERTWLRQALFIPSSMAVRQTACNIVEVLAQVPSRKQAILDMLSEFLDELGRNGEYSAEFLMLYKRLLMPGHWRYYLALKGVLLQIGRLINREINEISALEETTLNSELSQGYALKSLTELLACFVELDNIRHHFKGRLLGSTILNGYLHLRKLIIQRTKLIDETQDNLLELLEEMTTGTEGETQEFMVVCVQTIEKYPLTDLVSPVFIFERLCSTIFPEENEVGGFSLSLEKDPQQEDFLQGRMLGNPYSCDEPGLGPLMRDVKNKICQDCELVALLEDDTGMELLVCNKIISLDLPVIDVYKKIWVPQHGEVDAMRIVYRMRGLLGDATEDMVNTLDSGRDDDVDQEEVYKLANVMSSCGGLTLMLQRLAAIRNLKTGKQMLNVLLKLFSFCVKVKANRQWLCQPEANTISIMLGALNLALLAEQESGQSTKGQTLTEQILQIMETILQEASQQPPEIYKEFSALCGDKDQLMMLLDRINSPFVRANGSVLEALMRLIPFLAFGDQNKMLTLVHHFKPYLEFERYDSEHNQDESIHLDCFCIIALGIENNANGRRLKDLIVEKGLILTCLEYIQKHAPKITTMLATDSELWKEFLSKASLPFALRMLTGFSKGHDATQVTIGKDIILILHKLEQVSSDEHIGSLAENLLEALKENSEVALKIEEVRNATKAEKKRLAKIVREKQLIAFGMTANEKGQVTVKSSMLKQMEDWKEETGLTCCICREGYRYQPTKVLAIYTYTKRVNLDDFDLKQHKSHGYSTVSHFNVVHVDCHLAAVAAVRHARGREEWESAALQNANTRCNGLLPLWGPQVPESVFASCLARHNQYLQECTGVRDANYPLTIQDAKQLILRFALERSFSEDSGGGGRESNIHLLPYIMHMALYVMNTTRSVAREVKNLNNFLKQTPDKWLDNSYDPEGPLYWAVMATHLLDHDAWKQNRVCFLRRIIVLAHVRHLFPVGTKPPVTDKVVKEYSVYKPYLIFFALLDSVVSIMFKKCALGTEATWPAALAEFIRQNDSTLNEQGAKVLSAIQDEFAPCESLAEYCDVIGLLEEIPDADAFAKETLNMLP